MIDDKRPTTYKKRYRAQGRTLLRVNSFSEVEISDSIQKQIIDKLQKEIADTDLIIFSDFNYGILPQKQIDQITKLANSHGVFIAADSQTSSQTGDVSKFKNVNLVTPTEHEVRVALRDTSSGIAKLTGDLSKKSICENIIVTLGGEGIFIQNSGEKKGAPQTGRLPAFSQAAIDPAGAGDAFLVSAALALAAGGSIWTASWLGSIAAAIQVERLGNIPITYDELLMKLDHFQN